MSKKSKKLHPTLVQGAQDQKEQVSWMTWLGVAAIVVAAVIVYSPSMSGGFVLDDGDLLTNNRLIRDPNGLTRFWLSIEPQDYWPLSSTTFWFEWRLWGPNPTGYHATNLAIHIVASLLLWRLLKRLAIPGSFLAALLFAVHPVNVESVAWISQRKNVLSMLFYLLALLCYLRAYPPFITPAQPKEPAHRATIFRRYGLSLFCFLLGMLSKGSIAILPLVLMWIAWWLRRPLWKEFVRLIPFFAVAVILTAVNIWFQHHGSATAIRSIDFLERVCEAGAVIWFYLYKALWPWQLTFVYPMWDVRSADVWWWVPLIAALALTAVLWRNCSISWVRSIFFAWGYFCLALIPVMGLTDVGYMKYSLVADHYQYIAIVAVVALVAVGLHFGTRAHLRITRNLSKASACLLPILLGYLAYQQSKIYADAKTLYSVTLRNNPNSSLIRVNLGAIYSKAGLNMEAESELKQALAVDPNYADAHYNLAEVYYRAGQIREAMTELQAAIDANPKFVEAHNNLGYLLAKQGKTEEAISHYQTALQYSPSYPRAHFNMGEALMTQNRPNDAIEHYESALNSTPDYAEDCFHLAIAYKQAGRFDDALTTAEKAFKLARSQHQTDLAAQIDAWIRDNR